jgi:hypothetical protein
MAKHVTEWLGAYLDDELRGSQLLHVQAHLAECPSCQTEFKALQNLSVLLKETPSETDFTPTERFVSRAGRRLPPRQSLPTRRKVWEVGWWLVPLGLFAAWVFLQVTFGVSALVQAAGGADLLGNTATWLAIVPAQNEWLGITMNLFAGNLNGTGRQLLQLLGEADLLGGNFLVQFGWQVGMASLYWSWLIIWWLRRRKEPISIEAAKSL